MLKKGQIISKDGEKRKVLEVLGDIVITSIDKDFSKALSIIYLQSELQDWKVEGEDWKPALGEDFYYINGYGEIIKENCGDLVDENRLIAFKNVFRTREEAELKLTKIINLN